MATTMSNLDTLRKHTLFDFGNPTLDRQNSSDLFPIAEHDMYAEEDDNSTATGNTAELSRSDSGTSQENKPRLKSGDDDVNVQYVRFELEEGSSRDRDDGSCSLSPHADEISHTPTFHQIINNPSNHVEILDIKEQENDGYSKIEFDIAIEVYEDEIRRLEKLNAILTGNVPTLTAADDGQNTTIPEQVENSVAAVKGCQNCAGKPKTTLQEDEDPYVDMILRDKITLQEDEDLYVDMILREEKLQKKYKILKGRLRSEIHLVTQLSMNLKTAADKITEVSKEKDDWKAKFEELEKMILSEEGYIC